MVGRRTLSLQTREKESNRAFGGDFHHSDSTKKQDWPHVATEIGVTSSTARFTLNERNI